LKENFTETKENRFTFKLFPPQEHAQRLADAVGRASPSHFLFAGPGGRRRADEWPAGDFVRGPGVSGGRDQRGNGCRQHAAG